jgi:hypothetical protein
MPMRWSVGFVGFVGFVGTNFLVWFDMVGKWRGGDRGKWFLIVNCEVVRLWGCEDADGEVTVGTGDLERNEVGFIVVWLTLRPRCLPVSSVVQCFPFVLLTFLCHLKLLIALCYQELHDIYRQCFGVHCVCSLRSDFAYFPAEDIFISFFLHSYGSKILPSVLSIAGALRLLIDENGYLSYGEFLRLVPPPEFLVLSSRFKGPRRVPRATASNSFPSGQIMRRSYHRVYSFESRLEA